MRLPLVDAEPEKSVSGTTVLHESPSWAEPPPTPPPAPPPAVPGMQLKVTELHTWPLFTQLAHAKPAKPHWVLRLLFGG